MDPEDGLFNKFAREHRPLSRHLRSYADQLRYRLNAMHTDQVAELTREDVAQIVESFRCKPPTLGEPFSDERGPYAPGQYYTAVPVLEGAEFLRSWPDEIDGIDPIDAVDATAATQWQLWNVPQSPATLGIVTVIRLSEDEERKEREQPTLPQRFPERVDTARRYVDALAEQVQRFFDEKLVELGMDIVSRRQLTRSIAANLGFPQSWKIPAPKVITEPQNPPDQPSVRVGDSTGQPTTAPVAESTTAEHVVPYRHYLDPASFEDVQRVTRRWADGIERYPAAFSGLIEDRVSDLLAATLNATLPGAHREVYSRGGKSDIYIEADVLAAGSGPAKIFICESKWATSKEWVMQGVDPQLYGYLTTHDTSAMLLLLFRQQDFQSAKSNAYEWLHSIDGYVDEEPSAVEDWPIFLYVHGPYEIRLCVASVHLPPTDPADDSLRG